MSSQVRGVVRRAARGGNVKNIRWNLKKTPCTTHIKTSPVRLSSSAGACEASGSASQLSQPSRRRPQWRGLPKVMYSEGGASETPEEGPFPLKPAPPSQAKPPLPTHPAPAPGRWCPSPPHSYHRRSCALARRSRSTRWASCAVTPRVPRGRCSEG
jgi:hypothetical protein